MQPAVGQPWFQSAIERLDPRKRDRLLAIDCDAAQTRLLHLRIGSHGELTLVLRDPQLAEQIASKVGGERDGQVRVFTHDVLGDENFGTFDSLVVAPPTGPLLTAHAYAGLIRKNLRPGGRFVIDLPGENMVPDLRSAWIDLGWDEERLSPLSGPTDVELADALRAAGLRGVHAALGSHLLHLTAPADLVDSFGEILGLNAEERTELTHGIIRRRKDPGPLDALVHRTQVAGQR